VSPDQAANIVDAVDRLPLPPVRRRGEQTLLEEAGRLNATDLQRAARHLASVIDPERDEREAEKALDREERAAHLQRFLSISDDGVGGVRVKGRGSLEDAAALRAALLLLTNPEPSVDPRTREEQPDPRDHGARMWDGLIRLAQHALDTSLPPNSHGTRPRVVVTIDLSSLADAAVGYRGADSPAAGTGVTEDGLELPPPW